MIFASNAKQAQEVLFAHEDNIVIYGPPDQNDLGSCFLLVDNNLELLEHLFEMFPQAKVVPFDYEEDLYKVLILGIQIPNNIIVRYKSLNFTP